MNLNPEQESKMQEVAKMLGEAKAKLESLMAIGDDVLEMGLCETEHVLLKPNRTYRFVVMPDCDRCKELADRSEGR